jgi:hypothetical protein
LTLAGPHGGLATSYKRDASAACKLPPMNEGTAAQDGSLRIMTEMPEGDRQAVQREFDPADAASIDGLISAFYECANDGTPPRARDRATQLFAPDARITVIGRSERGELLPAEARSVADWRKSSTADAQDVEVERNAEFFAAVGHVLSAFETRQRDGGGLRARGVNSFQLVWREGRWWVLSVVSDRIGVVAARS